MDYKEEQNKNYRLELKIKDLEREHSEKLSNVRTKLRTTRSFLVKMNEDVVKPMIHEMKIAEELKNRYQQ